MGFCFPSVWNNSTVNQSLFVWRQFTTKAFSWHFPNQTPWFFYLQWPNISSMSEHLGAEPDPVVGGHLRRPEQEQERSYFDFSSRAPWRTKRSLSQHMVLLVGLAQNPDAQTRARFLTLKASSRERVEEAVGSSCKNVFLLREAPPSSAVSTRRAFTRHIQAYVCLRLCLRRPTRCI